MKKILIISLLIIFVLNCKSISVTAPKYNIYDFVCLKSTLEIGYILYQQNNIYTIQVQQKGLENKFTYYIRDFNEEELENCIKIKEN